VFNITKAMPKKLAVDHELAKALILQGVKTQEIARKIGVKVKTRETWINRYHWRDLRDRTKQALQEADHDDLSMQLASQSADIRRKLASDLAKAASDLPKHSRKLPVFKVRQEAIGNLVDNAAKVFGWKDESKPSSIVNIALLTTTPDTTGYDHSGKESLTTIDADATIEPGDTPSTGDGDRREGV